MKTLTPLLAVALLVWACSDSERSERAENYSSLWGKAGELWSPESRLPDFSYAGYAAGKQYPPRLPATANVRDYGAIGDGTTDDSDAFLRALAEAPPGAIEIPAGRYRLTKVLELRASRRVLRGAGPGETTLYFPEPLSAVLDKGAYGGPYGWAWGGGWIWAHGEIPADEMLARVLDTAPRGSKHLRVSSSANLKPGQFVRLVQRESDGSLTLHLHNGQELNGRCWVDRPGGVIIDWAVEIATVSEDSVELVRPLRADVQPQWQPELLSYKPSVTDVGVEHLTIEFPATEQAPHHEERGYNAIFFHQIHNSWVRDVHIVNADNGVTLWLSRYTSVEHVVLDGRGGHYGFNLLATQDCLVRRFQIRNRSLHDLSVSNLANGNVYTQGTGVAINFDHHRGAAYENLYSDIDVGESWRGKRLWDSSGTLSGHYTAARETYWNIRPSVSTRWLPAWPQMNVIGPLRQREHKGTPTLNDLHVEGVYGLQPVDLYAAQKRRRTAGL